LRKIVTISSAKNRELSSKSGEDGNSDNSGSNVIVAIEADGNSGSGGSIVIVTIVAMTAALR
jgi:hypothetical protein